MIVKCKIAKYQKKKKIRKMFQKMSEEFTLHDGFVYVYVVTTYSNQIKISVNNKRLTSCRRVDLTIKLKMNIFSNKLLLLFLNKYKNHYSY